MKTMGKVISFLNFKGGVGKSTSTVNTAKALHDMGYQVLVIDADAQGNSSKMMGKKLNDNLTETLYEILTKGLEADEAIYLDQEKEGSFNYIPSSPKLDNAESDLSSMVGREFILKNALKPVSQDYDFILIDCAPSSGWVSMNAMMASDYLIVPLNGEPFAVDGMGKIIQRYKEIKALKNNFNEDLQILGYVFTLIRKCGLHDDAKTALATQHEKYGWPGSIFNTEIKQNVCLAESGARRTNVFDYADMLPDNNFMNRNKKATCMKAAEQYKELAMEILQRVGMSQPIESNE